jgi:hypothetical protein
MIGYPISQADLEESIENAKRGWIQKAKERTEDFRSKGYYGETSPFWSEIKPVYMELQGNCKCAYCERKLESIGYGKIEQDIEHFRPKGKIKAWKIPKSLKDDGIVFTEVPDVKHGYYLLPYHPFNYISACKPCNSALKKNYFPIAGVYSFDGEDPIDLMKEKPYLIYPIGDFDSHPEKLIGFYGISPQAISSDKYERARAKVTIEFFKLDSMSKRENLLQERACIIILLHPQLEKLADGNASDEDKADAEIIINNSISSNSPHTNCARSFKKLFENNRAEAKNIYKYSVQFIKSGS